MGIDFFRSRGHGFAPYWAKTPDDEAPMRTLNPVSIAPPLARYAHGVEVAGPVRMIRTSGQLGVTVDGSVPPTAAEQAQVCFSNIRAILAEGGMEVANICHISAWLTDRADLPAYMATRDTFLEGSSQTPASTLLIVAGLSRPEFKVEVEVWATAPL